VGGDLASTSRPVIRSRRACHDVLPPVDWSSTPCRRAWYSLTINDKAVVQFTIEVPQAGLEILFVHSDRSAR
jgi:hypothetical protein